MEEIVRGIMLTGQPKSPLGIEKTPRESVKNSLESSKRLTFLPISWGNTFKELSEVIINMAIKLGKIGYKFLVGELERDFARSDRDKFSAWGFTRVTC